MGAWCYCPHCDAGHDKPTAREAVVGYRECRSCRRTFDTHRGSKDDLLIELAERLDEVTQNLDEALNRIRDLEDHVWKLINTENP